MEGREGGGLRWWVQEGDRLEAVWDVCSPNSHTWTACWNSPCGASSKSGTLHQAQMLLLDVLQRSLFLFLKQRNAMKGSILKGLENLVRWLVPQCQDKVSIIWSRLRGGDWEGIRREVTMHLCQGPKHHTWPGTQKLSVKFLTLPLSQISPRNCFKRKVPVVCWRGR